MVPTEIFGLNKTGLTILVAVIIGLGFVMGLVGMAVRLFLVDWAGKKMQGATPDQIRRWGRIVRNFEIVKDTMSGAFVSIFCVGAGFGLLLIDHRNERMTDAGGLWAIGGIGLVVTVVQLWRRISLSKQQSGNLAYQATVGDVTINKKSTLGVDLAGVDLVSQSVRGWAGPVFSNQNMHVVGFGVDATPNTENVLVVTGDYLIGLLIGPGDESGGLVSNALNILPSDMSTKNAMGAVFNAAAIQANAGKQLSTRSITNLVHEHGIFALSLGDIASVTMPEYFLKITLHSGKGRSWQYPPADQRLASVFEALNTLDYNTRTVDDKA